MNVLWTNSFDEQTVVSAVVSAVSEIVVRFKRKLDTADVRFRFSVI